MAKNKFASAVVALVGAAVVAGLFQFNYSTSSYNQYLVGNMIALFWVPMLSIFLVVRSPASFGFALCGSKRVWVTHAGRQSPRY